MRGMHGVPFDYVILPKGRFCRGARAIPTEPLQPIKKFYFPNGRAWNHMVRHSFGLLSFFDASSHVPCSGASVSPPSGIVGPTKGFHC